MIAKSMAIKGRGGRSGGRAAKAVVLTSGGLRRVSATGLRPPQGDLTAVQKSADGIVGGSAPLKARTLEEASRAAISREPCGRRISWS
jgi:RNA-directed DNA polymerase